MMWNIANAKQQFSEVVRLTAVEPQAIYNRDKPVAVMISAADFEEFKQLRAERRAPSLTELFAQFRAAAIDDGFEDGIDVGPRVDRPSPFDDLNWNA